MPKGGLVEQRLKDKDECSLPPKYIKVLIFPSKLGNRIATRQHISISYTRCNWPISQH